MQKGITLAFAPAATPKKNTGVNIKTGTTVLAKMNADANGELSGDTTVALDGTYTDGVVTLTGEDVAIQKSYDVYLNDVKQTLTGEAGSQKVDISGLENTILVAAKKDGTYAEAAGTIVDGTIRYTAVPADVYETDGTEIKLYTAYKVTTSDNTRWKLYTEKFVDGAQNEAMTANSVKYILAQPGEIKQLWVEAVAGYTLLEIDATKDASHKAKMEIMLQSTATGGVWVLNFQGEVKSDFFKDTKIFTPSGAKVELTAEVGTTVPSAGVAVTGISDVPTTGLTVAASVKKEASVTQELTVTANIESDKTVKVKVQRPRLFRNPPGTIVSLATSPSL